MSSASLSIGFLGAGGIMGKGMVLNLAKKLSNPLVLWNRSSSPLDELMSTMKQSDCYHSDKISIACSAREVVEKSDVIFLMLSTEEASKAVFDDENNGVVAALKSGVKNKLIVDCATVSPQRMQYESKLVKSFGCEFLEAPVSGSKVPAETGTLIFLCGGESSVYSSVTEYLQAMGKASYLFGEVGKGSQVKLVVNMLLGTMMASFAEATSLAKGLDLPLEELFAVIDQSALSNPMFRMKGSNNILKNDFNAHFPLKHAQKDMRLALELSDEMNLDLPTSKAANEEFMNAMRQDMGDLDLSAVFKAIDRSNK